jgi:flagellar basal-body rod protein FlgF
LQLSDGSQAESATTVQVESGFLESSNVNPIDELISSMSLTRSFELQVKLMESSDSQAKQGNELISG